MNLLRKLIREYLVLEGSFVKRVFSADEVHDYIDKIKHRNMGNPGKGNKGGLLRPAILLGNPAGVLERYFFWFDEQDSLLRAAIPGQGVLTWNADGLTPEYSTEPGDRTGLPENDGMGRWEPADGLGSIPSETPFDYVQFMSRGPSEVKGFKVGDVVRIKPELFNDVMALIDPCEGDSCDIDDEGLEKNPEIKPTTKFKIESLPHFDDAPAELEFNVKGRPIYFELELDYVEKVPKRARSKSN